MKEYLKLKKARRFKYLLKNISGLPDELKKLCKPNSYNMLLYMHLGDDFFRSYVYHDFINAYQKKLHLIIQPNEVCLMDLWGIKDYSIFDIDAYLKKHLETPTADRVIYEYTKQYLITHTLPSIPQISSPFSCDENILMQKWLKKFGTIESAIDHVYAYLGIMKKKKISAKEIKYPRLSVELKKKLDNIAPLDKIILVAPEARSDDLLHPSLWHEITDKFHELGYTIIENIVNKENHIPGSINLHLNTDELLQLCSNCKAVFSIRSGLCDIMAGIGDKLHILYSSERFRELGSKNFYIHFDFTNQSQPHEYVLSKKSSPLIMFDGVNLLKDINPLWLPKQFKPSVSFLEQILSIKNERKHKVIRLLGIKIKFKRGKYQKAAKTSSKIDK